MTEDDIRLAMELFGGTGYNDPLSQYNRSREVPKPAPKRKSALDAARFPTLGRGTQPQIGLEPEFRDIDLKQREATIAGLSPLENLQAFGEGARTVGQAAVAGITQPFAELMGVPADKFYKAAIDLPETAGGIARGEQMIEGVQDFFGAMSESPLARFVEKIPPVSPYSPASAQAIDTGLAQAGKGLKLAAEQARKQRQYETSQEGAFYRVRPVTKETGRALRGNKEEAGRGAETPGGSVRGDVSQPITDDALTEVMAKPDNFVRSVASDYAQQVNNRPYELPEMAPSSLLKQAPIGRVFDLAVSENPQYKKAVFEAYGRSMPEVIEQSGAKNYDQLVEAAYRQLAKETDDQFRRLPVNMSYHRAGEGNYSDSRDMLRDVYGNRHLYVFQGGDPHPFMSRVDPETGLNDNEKFRAVHDFFGHAIHGNQFGPKGEETAWLAHSQMYSPLARLAMSTETRGQNSVVNYTPLNAKLKARLSEIEGRIYEARRRGQTDDLKELQDIKKGLFNQFQFAPQYGLLLPPEMIRPDFAGKMPDYVRPLIQPAPGTATGARLFHYGKEPGIKVTDPSRYGTGIKGAEAARLEGASDIRPRTYFYTDPNKPPEAGLGPYRYRGEADLYNLEEDPLAFRTLAAESLRSPFTAKVNPGMVDPSEAITATERLVKEYGYPGYMTPESGTAAVFQPVPVQQYAEGGAVTEEDDPGRLQRLINLYQAGLLSLDDLTKEMRGMRPYDVATIFGGTDSNPLMRVKPGDIERMPFTPEQQEEAMIPEGLDLDDLARMDEGETEEEFKFRGTPNIRRLDREPKPADLNQPGEVYLSTGGAANLFEVPTPENLALDPILAEEREMRRLKRAQEMAQRPLAEKAKGALEAAQTTASTVGRGVLRPFAELAGQAFGEKGMGERLVQSAPQPQTEVGKHYTGEVQDVMQEVGKFLEPAKIPQGPYMPELIPSLPYANRPQMLTQKLEEEFATPPIGAVQLQTQQAPRNPLGMYSQAEQVALNLPQQKGTGNQFLAQISKTPGVKPAELEWTGLADFLKSKGDQPVTKQEIQQHLDANRVQVQEVTLGSNPRFFEDPKIAEDVALLRSAGYEPRSNPDDVLNFGFVAKDGDILNADDIGSIFSQPPFKIADAAQRVQDFFYAQSASASYKDLQLPGGSNYREVLLTLPEKKIPSTGFDKSPDTLMFEQEMMDKYGGQSFSSVYAQLSLPELYKYDTLLRFDRNATPPPENIPSIFQSSHFEQPNILAHMRLNDRVDANGDKVLFVEEMQSDWGQKGREQGFAGNLDKQLAEVLKKTREAQRNTGDVFDRLIATGLSEQQVNSHPEFIKAYEQERAIKQEYGELTLRSKSNIPSAPFVSTQQYQVIKDGKPLVTKNKENKDVQHVYDSPEDAQRAAQKFGGEVKDLGMQENTEGWVNLALKRLITDAVNNGYKKVAFINGEQSAERYGLAGTVDAIQVTPSELRGRARDQLQFVDLQMKGGQQPVELTVNKNGIVINTDTRRYEQLRGKPLSEVVGKELSEKIMTGGAQVIKGEGLKVGGEGMKKFYDQIVPATANKLLKKLGGGKLEPIDFPAKSMISQKDYASYGAILDIGLPGQDPPKFQQLGFTITPEMVELVKNQGLPMFAAGGAVTMAKGGKVAKGMSGISAAREAMKAQRREERVQKNLEAYMGSTEKPQTYYHATQAPKDFRKFDLEKRPTPRSAAAVFVTPSTKWANDWAVDELANMDLLEKVDTPKPRIMPVITRAKNTFDYDDLGHVTQVMNQADLPPGLDRQHIADQISIGNWNFIEDRNIQKAIKDLGFDSFFVKEKGVKNMGIFDPGDVKALFNRGSYDPTTSDISKAGGGMISADDIRQKLKNAFNFAGGGKVEPQPEEPKIAGGGMASMSLLERLRAYKKGGEVRMAIGGDAAKRVKAGFAAAKKGMKAKAQEDKKPAYSEKVLQSTTERMAAQIQKENPKMSAEDVLEKAQNQAKKKLTWEREEKPALEKTYGELRKAPYYASLTERKQNVPAVVQQRIEETERFLAQPTEPWEPPRKELQAFDRERIKDALEGFPGIEQTRFPRYQAPRSGVLGMVQEIYQDPVNRRLIEGQIKRGLPLGGETFYASLYPLKLAALERGIPEQQFNQFVYSIAPASARNSIMNEMAVGQFLRDMNARGLPLDEKTVEKEMERFKKQYGTGLPLMPVHRKGVQSVIEGDIDLREHSKADIPTSYKIPTYGTQKAGDFAKSVVLDVHEAAGQTRGSRYHPYFTEQGGFSQTEYGPAESEMLDIAQGLGIPGGMAQAGRWFGGGELTGLKSPRGDALDLLERQAAYTLQGQGINPTPRAIRNFVLDMVETGRGELMPYFKKTPMPDYRTEKKKGGLATLKG